MADSDSERSSSSDDEGESTQALAHIAATTRQLRSATTAAANSGAGQGKPTAAVAGTKASGSTRVTPVTSKPREAPRPPALNANDVESKPTTRELDNVTHAFNAAIGYDKLLKSANAGKSLELTGANKTLHLTHSNPNHKLTDATSSDELDFVQNVKVHLDRAADMALTFTTKVPAMLGEADTFPHGVTIAPDSVTDAAPYGLIAIAIPAGKTEAGYDRKVTEGQVGFITTYPGQTASNAASFVHKVTNHAGGKGYEYAVQAKEPQAAVVHFYNQHPSIKGTDKELTDAYIDANADKRGRVYVSEVKAMEDAIATTEKTIKARIGYTNVSNAATAGLVISGSPQSELDSNFKPTHYTPPLTHALRHTAAYRDHQQRGNMTGLAKVEDAILRGTETNAPKFSVAGSVAYGYHRVTPNFKLEAE